MIRKVRTALVGLGNVNRSLLKILLDKQEEIAARYQLSFIVVAVADSSGVAISPSGFDYNSLLHHKVGGKKVRELKEYVGNSNAEQITNYIDCDLLVEASPVNLKDGSPGLNTVKSALTKGCHVVLANKGPLVLAFDELKSLKGKHQAHLRYSATVCGGLPVVNLLMRDLKVTQLQSVKGIFNATSNFVLQELEKGNSMQAAIAEAQTIGAAETDPTLDLSGQDTANKLFIIMKSSTNFSGSIKDIQMTGIEAVTGEQLSRAKMEGETIKLIASATPKSSGWNLKVEPESIPATSFLGSINGWEMGLEVHTDLYESISMKNYEADPMGTSAAVLRDMIEIFNII